MKPVLLFLTCCLITSAAFAQSTLKGVVMEVRTDVMLSGIQVENLTDHSITYTHAQGVFAIKAKKGDLICFSGLNYQADTVYLINLKHLTVLLELRSNQLADVKIKAITPNANYYNSTAETGMFGSHTIMFKPGGGLRIKIFDSHANAKSSRHLEKLELESQQEHEIAIAFSTDTVRKYVSLSGIELNNFILKYRPNIKTFNSSRFNLAAYINDSYKDFMKIPEDKRKSPTWLQLNGPGN